ncbi:MAG: hypothetical protein ACKOBG_07120 [Actinomycetota bacterium]
MSDREDLVRARLESIEEELRDLEYSALARRAADPEGEDAAAARAEERRLARARRAVARAVAALGGTGETGDDWA